MLLNTITYHKNISGQCMKQQLSPSEPTGSQCSGCRCNSGSRWWSPSQSGWTRSRRQTLKKRIKGRLKCQQQQQKATNTFAIGRVFCYMLTQTRHWFQSRFYTKALFMFCVPIPCRAVPRYGPGAAAALCGGEAGAVAVAASAELNTKGKSYTVCFGDGKRIIMWPEANFTKNRL